MTLAGPQYRFRGHTVTFAKALRPAEPISVTLVAEIDGERAIGGECIPRWFGVFLRPDQE